MSKNSLDPINVAIMVCLLPLALVLLLELMVLLLPLLPPRILLLLLLKPETNVFASAVDTVPVDANKEFIAENGALMLL